VNDRRNNQRTHRLAMRFSVTGAAVSIALGLAAPDARADMLDFEDLPPFQPEAQSGTGFRPLTPNYAYHGFILSAVHTANDGPFGVNNAWYYTRVLEAVQDPPYQPGMTGISWCTQSGEYGLRTGPNVNSGQSTFSFSRSDGGLFSFDGAWFTRIYSQPNQGLNVTMQGFVGNTVAYTYWQPIFLTTRTFVAPPPGVAVDRVVFRTGFPQPNSQGGFYMDDFHYTLVPAPSVLAVLGGLGLFRKRAR
jgi:hypothetical protein